jgi:hypothetical protein
MWPIIIQGSKVSKKGCDSLVSKRACNEACGGHGKCPAELSGYCGTSPINTTAETVSAVHSEGTWTSPQPRLPLIVVFCNCVKFHFTSGHGAQIPGARHHWQLKSVAAPNSLFLGIQSGPSPYPFSGTWNYGVAPRLVVNLWTPALGNQEDYNGLDL